MEVPNIKNYTHLSQNQIPDPEEYSLFIITNQEKKTKIQAVSSQFFRSK